MNIDKSEMKRKLLQAKNCVDSLKTNLDICISDRDMGDNSSMMNMEENMESRNIEIALSEEKEESEYIKLENRDAIISIIQHIINLKRQTPQYQRILYHNSSTINNNFNEYNTIFPNNTQISPIYKQNNKSPLPTLKRKYVRTKPLKNKPQKLPRRKHQVVFKNFSIHEKERILYDKIILGIRVCERKWGIDISNVMHYKTHKECYKTEEEKLLWMKRVQETIETQMRMLDIEYVISNIQRTLIQNTKSGEEPFTFNDLSNFSFDKGLAKAASMFKINLFELEYLLINMYTTEWAAMEKECWFSPIIDPINNKRVKIGKEEAVRMAKKYGNIYASKKSGINVIALHQYRKAEDMEAKWGNGKDVETIDIDLS